MSAKTRIFLTSLTIVILMAAVPMSALAASITNFGITLFYPDSFTSCTPSSIISTSGVSTTIWYRFFIYNTTTGNMDMLGNGYASSDISVPFPYPAIQGTMTFVAEIINMANTTQKLSAQWSVSCTPPPPPPPPGGQGCTPGYWKQANHYDSWPVAYQPSTLFFSAFGVNAFPGMPLSVTIGLSGGGLNYLGRASTAALLNAATVAYPYSVGQVITMFSSAFISGNYTPTADLFNAANNLNCPLN